MRPSADWSKPPYVDPNTAKELDEMAGDESYEGMSEEQARQKFREYSCDWDSMIPEQLTSLIKKIKGNRGISDDLGPACLVFCDKVIPKEFSRRWTIAVMAARDVHEEEEFSDDSDSD